MRRIAIVVGFALGFFLIIRAIIEPFAIDMTDPSTYRDDWGGPGLAGVLVVHCGPGLVTAVIIAAVLMRRHRARSG